MCTVSTLYASLQAVSQAGHEPASSSRGNLPYFPHDGAILSMGVEVFREGTMDGYSFMRSAFSVDVVSVAMCNRNAEVTDSPLDAPRDPAAYEQLIASKCRAAVHCAALSGAAHLVACDVGCGVFKNDPRLVGRLLGQALALYDGYFRRISFAGKHEFAEAAVSAMRCGSSNVFVNSPGAGYRSQDSEDERAVVRSRDVSMLSVSFKSDQSTTNTSPGPLR